MRILVWKTLRVCYFKIIKILLFFADILSEQFIHILGGSDILQPDFSSDYSTIQDVSVDKQKDRDFVKPKEVLDRLKFAIKKSASFIICRGNNLVKALLLVKSL